MSKASRIEIVEGSWWRRHAGGLHVRIKQVNGQWVEYETSRGFITFTCTRRYFLNYYEAVDVNAVQSLSEAVS